MINNPKSFLFSRIGKEKYFNTENGFNPSSEQHQNCGDFFISCSKPLLKTITVSMISKAANDCLRTYYHTRGCLCLVCRQFVLMWFEPQAA